MNVLTNNALAKIQKSRELVFENNLIDESSIKTANNVAKSKLKYNPELLIIVGVGGSSNGVKAALGFKKPKIKTLFAEGLDSDKLFFIKKSLETALKSGTSVLINAISKSGKTIETLAGLEVLTKTLKKYAKDWQERITITSALETPLHKKALKENITFLEVPKNITGRYSIFTNAGLFPLKILGFDIKALIKGAKKTKEIFAKKTALIKYYHYKKGRRINVFFPFSESFYGFKEWANQLVAESLGKNRTGITPITSIGTPDLHSMLQLYLGGPDDKFTTFIKVKNEYNVRTSFGDYEQMLDLTYKCIKNEYKRFKRPFIELVLENKREECMGELFMHLMLETIFFAKLLGINPFDQPNVEHYKEILTRKLKFA